eukprot:TRINITY_DN67819_c0_g1_i1.p1 TRINITY_DN67819_c0_g1~~TRINITY_DN67819_c0_g1_i1.p1  ORF type:complete len:778 (+),score=110.33 TRINITY_DN67819_c0_g1_i1:179-2512(+)
MGVFSGPINEEILSCVSWHEILACVVRHGEAMDELNIVTALHRVAKLYRDEDGGRTPVRVVHTSRGLSDLLELTRHFVPRCKAQQLSNALWGCAVLDIHDADLLQKLCDFAVQRLAWFVPQNVANSTWAIATLSFVHENFLSGVGKYIEANVKDYSPQDLANTCWAYAKLQVCCESVLALVVAECLVKTDQLQAQNFSNTIWGCATLLYRDEESMMSLANSSASRVGEFGTQEMSNLSWGMATLAYKSETWLEASGAEMARRVRECIPQDLSNTIWAYGTLMHKINEHMHKINAEVMRQIEGFSMQGLSNVIWGLSAMEYRDQWVLTCISEEVVRRPLEQFIPPDISTLLYSFAVHAWSHQGALAKLRRAARRMLPHFATRDVANVSWSLVTLSHRDDDLSRRLMIRAEDMMTEFTVQGLCNIAWAFVRLGLPVPGLVARGIAEETLKKLDELEPGDALLLSDAVCTEWAAVVPQPLVDELDAVARRYYNAVLAFLSDWTNIPDLGADEGVICRYQERVESFMVVHVGRRLTVEILGRLGMLESSDVAITKLRALRKLWMLEELEKVEDTDATLQHKTVATWQLDSDGRGNPCPARVLASGSPMDCAVRFIPCVVEHPRASDAEFQVVNLAAEALLRGADISQRTLRLDVSEIPCLSCIGALRQFQKAFPGVPLRVSFSVRTVAEVEKDRSGDIAAQYRDGELPAHDTRAPPPGPDNRGRRIQRIALPPPAPPPLPATPLSRPPSSMPPSSQRNGSLRSAEVPEEKVSRAGQPQSFY